MQDWIVPLILAVIAALPGWYAAFFRTPKRDVEEIKKIKADTLKVSEEAEALRLDRAERLTNKIEVLELRIQQVECENDLLLIEVDKLKELNTKLITENGDLRQWAVKLVEQIKTSNQEPVILDRRRANRK